MKGGVGETGDKGEKGEKGADATSAGVVYTAWGLSECPTTEDTVTLLQGGLMSTSPKAMLGSGANYICLPSNPTFSAATSPSSSPLSRIAGVVYSTSGEVLATSHGTAAPCSVCFTTQAVQLMIPGRATCPGAEWRLEYRGYLMSSRDTPGQPLSTEDQDNHRFRTEYACVAAETVGIPLSGSEGCDSELYHVHLNCEAGTSLDCSTRGYTSAQQLTCAVCTLKSVT